MSFILETSKTGKDIILFNNYKYRESYAVKCGDIVWKCLGRNCKASIKTDAGKTAIFFCNETHNGTHPVTMRAFTPTPPRKHCPTTSATLTTPPLDTAPVREAQQPHSQVADAEQTPAEEQQRSVRSASPPTADLLAENNTLKEELLKLREEFRVILDHSVDSDQRLLEYTEDIFLPPPSTTAAATHPPARSCTYVSSMTQTDDAWDALGETQSYFRETLTPQDILLENKKLANNCKILNNKVMELEVKLLNLQQEKKCLDNEATLNVNELDRLSPSDAPDSLPYILPEKGKSLENVSLELNDALRVNRILNSELEKCKNQLTQCVTSDKWLDDSVIQSYFSSFNDSLKATSSRTLFLDPATCELLKHSSIHTVKKELNCLKVESFDYIFLSVNDNQSTEWKGDSFQSSTIGHGSHWSLLFIDRTKARAFHLDSLGNYNLKHARSLAGKLAIRQDKFHSIVCEKQNNGFECGINVILNAKLIMNCYCSNVLHKNIDFETWYSQFLNNCHAGIAQPEATSHSSNSSTYNTSPLQPNTSNVNWKVVKSEQGKIVHKKVSTSIAQKKLNSLQTNNINTVPPKKISLLSDSHGRGLSKELIVKLGRGYKVSSLVKPNATLNNVISGINHETYCMRDTVILMAGTNDIPDSCDSLEQSLKAMLDSHKHTNVIVIGLPRRHDQPHLNHLVHKTNKVYQKLVDESSHATFISINSISRSCFTRHGLHLNSLGKNKVVNLIVNEVVPRDVKISSNCSHKPSHIEVKSQTTFGQSLFPERNPKIFFKKKQNTSTLNTVKTSNKANIRRAEVSKTRAVRDRVWVNSSLDFDFLGWTRDRVRRP